MKNRIVASRKRIRRRSRREPADNGPLVIIGQPAMSVASAVPGADITYEWPITSRPTTPEYFLRRYSAANGGAPLATIAVPSTLPNNVGSYVVPVFKVFDTYTGQFVEVEGTTRLLITSVVVNNGQVQRGDVTWITSWTDPNNRVLFRPTQITVAGVGRNDGLQTRISTERYTTGWVDCPLTDNVAGSTSTQRNYPVIARHATQPGVNATDFWHRSEDRYSIQFRKKLGADGAWTNPGTLKHKAAYPAVGALQPSYTVTTAAALNTALNAAFLLTAPQLIVLSAGFAGGTTIDHANKVKPGGPLIITQADHANPVTLTSWTGRRMEFNGCHNVIIDGLRFVNDRTESVGGFTDSSGVFYEARQINTGSAFRADNAQRFHIINCYFSKTRNTIYSSFSSGLFVGFCEFNEGSEDDIRLFDGAHDCTIQGVYSHDPDIYQEFTAMTGGNNYHCDFVQTAMRAASVGQPRAGYPNLKLVGNYMEGFTGYKAPFQFSSGGTSAGGGDFMDTDAELAQYGHSNILIKDNYFLTGWACTMNGWGPGLVENNVWRRFPGGGAGQINIAGRIRDVILRNNVSYSQVAFRSTTTDGMSSAVRQTEVIGRMTVSTTAFPPNWPATQYGGGADRSFAYPVGPYAYAY